MHAPKVALTAQKAPSQGPEIFALKAAIGRFGIPSSTESESTASDAYSAPNSPSFSSIVPEPSSDLTMDPQMPVDESRLSALERELLQAKEREEQTQNTLQLILQ